MREAEIARRLKVAHKTVTRAVAGVEVVVADALELAAAQEPGDGSAAVEHAEALVDTAESTVGVDGRSEAGGSAEQGDDGSGESAAGSARIGTGSYASRYAGATLLYPFLSLLDTSTILAAAIGAGGTDRPGLRFDDLAVLTETCVSFGLGFAPPWVRGCHRGQGRPRRDGGVHRSTISPWVVRYATRGRFTSLVHGYSHMAQ